MASVEKMLIKGIRSFSPDNQNVIDFHKPLTLIVGQNGAGKTTIIECLRMACSGSLPPNTRSGQSFIHDPKVANDTEVKGQIRLRIQGNNQQPVVIVRSFQLTQKKSSLQFKALDQVLQTINKETGEKQALTYKCADIDRIIPTIMGVSKAIIENVIFVHQEDANWPLAEPKVLKERFDDVFAATKYTKALEAIRKLRLEKVQEVRELKLKLDHLRTHKEMANHLSSEIGDSQAKSQQMESQMEEVQSQMDDLQRQAAPLRAKLGELEKLGNRIMELTMEQKTLSKHNSDMFAKLKEGDYEEDTEQLEKWVRQFDERLRSRGLEFRKTEREIQNTNMNAAALKEQHTRLSHHQGKLQAEADTHEKHIVERNSLLLSFAEDLNFSDLTGKDMNQSSVVSEARMRIRQKIQEMEDDLVILKAEARAKDEKACEAIESVAMKMSVATESMRTKSEEVDHNVVQQEAIQNRMKEFVVSDQMVDSLRHQESEALSKLNDNKAEQQARNLGYLLEEATKNIVETQKKFTALRKERDQLFAATEAQTQYRIKHKELLAKEKQVDELLEVHRSTIKSTLGQDVDVALLRGRADDVCNQLKADLHSKTHELSIVQNKASTLKGTVESAKQQLESYERALNESRRALREGLQTALGEQVCETDYQGHLTQHEKDSSKMVEKMSQVKASIKVMSAYVSMASEEGGCPLCKRKFTEQERDAFVQETSEEIKQLPGQVSSMESRLAELQLRLGGLKHLQPMWVRFSDLRDKQIPNQKEVVNLAESKLNILENEAEDLESLCGLVKHDVETVQKLLEQVIWPLDSAHNEVCSLRQEVNRLERLGEKSIVQRDSSDIDKELGELETSIATWERKKDETVRDQNQLRDEFVVLSNSYRDLKEAVEKQIQNARLRDELQAQLNELDRQKNSLELQLAVLSTEMQAYEPRKESLVEERSKARAEAHDAETKQENKVRSLRTTFDELQFKMNLIQEYEAANKAEALADVTQQLKDQDARMVTLQDRIGDLERQRKTFEDEIRNQEELKRAINDCLDWRRGKMEVEKMSALVADIKKSMQEIGDQKKITDELGTITKKNDELRSKLDMMKGAFNTVQQRISKAKKDLSSQNYVDVQARCSKAELEVANMSKANLDLDKYHRALEKALLSFHTTKMSDINKIVKELWQKTYRGHDIDYIQIRTDTEGVGKASYNYRLTMVVGGAELEMRGRCSTGQKVLACIIVRLALAETFCLNCGILSLDEPTTNLDEANARSLAEALRIIIEARRQQENFQLIVITHDENFAQMLGSREHSEKLWKVTKDENHHSLITLEDMP